MMRHWPAPGNGPAPPLTTSCLCTFFTACPAANPNKGSRRLKPGRRVETGAELL
jgi:hypothetical protein